MGSSKHTAGSVVLDVDVRHREAIALTKMTLAQVVFTVFTADRCEVLMISTPPITATGSTAAV